jgi:hypothetical protein
VRVLSTTAYLGDSAKERFASRDAA